MGQFRGHCLARLGEPRPAIENFAFAAKRPFISAVSVSVVQDFMSRGAAVTDPQSQGSGVCGGSGSRLSPHAGSTVFGELACTLKNSRNSSAGPATRACSSSTVHATRRPAARRAAPGATPRHHPSHTVS